MAGCDGEPSAATGTYKTDIMPSSLQSILDQMDENNESLTRRIEDLTTTANAAAARILELKGRVAEENEYIQSLFKTLTDILGPKTTELTEEDIERLGRALQKESFSIGYKR